MVEITERNTGFQCDEGGGGGDAAASQYGLYHLRGRGAAVVLLHTNMINVKENMFVVDYLGEIERGQASSSKNIGCFLLKLMGVDIDWHTIVVR